MNDKTLRDEIAIEAMKALMASFGVVAGPTPSDADIARYAYDMADAMLNERDKEAV